MTKNRQDNKPRRRTLLGRLRAPEDWTLALRKQFKLGLDSISATRTEVSMIFLLVVNIITVIINQIVPITNHQISLNAGSISIIVISATFCLLFWTQKRSRYAIINMSIVYIGWALLLASSTMIIFAQIADSGTVITYIVFALLICSVPVLSPVIVAIYLAAYTCFTIATVFLYAPSVAQRIVCVQNTFLGLIISGYVWTVQYLGNIRVFAEKFTLNEQNTQLSELAYRDPLTRLSNRRGFRNIVENYAMSGVSEYALFMLDIDNFKEYNDIYFHDAGDVCLQKIADALRNVAKGKYDVACRYGGEEFVVCIANTKRSEVVSIGYKIQEEIRKQGITFNMGTQAQLLTVSIGAAHSEDVSPANILPSLQNADVELYHAKANGKNCVAYKGEIYGSENLKEIQSVRKQNPFLKTILIVDDNEINLQILSKVLSDEYNAICVNNGQRALDALESKRHIISAVLLDIVMPVMSGYDFLKIVTQQDEYKNLPIIVMTGDSDKDSEKKALMLGAWDFVTKPYDATVVRFRLRNAIARSQLSAFDKLRYLADYDELTGIYNRNKFFQTVEEMLLVQPNKKHAMVRFDINRFQLVNSFYGTQEGDKLLTYIAQQLYALLLAQPDKIVCGRIEADVFGYCHSYDNEQELLSTVDAITSAIKQYQTSLNLTCTFGIYKITENISVSWMFDRAATAAKRAKMTHEENCVFYDEKMGHEIEREQFISNTMQGALENNEFIIYLQPKIDLFTRKPVGAEALVRWNHPTRGMISPGEFIPIFERNGFILKLDYFVWENVCKKLAQWISEGKQPYPISVNLSRVNIYNKDLVYMLCSLTKKYGIPNRLLQLEITESVYTDNRSLMHSVVSGLRDAGFLVMMDDFGAGYSSLNILKDVDVDVLKVDLGFLSDTDNPQRSRDIVLSVVEMAKRLNVPVIAEGVEREEQADFLTSIGCEYAQGYYFARPMPCEQYEQKGLIEESGDIKDE